MISPTPIPFTAAIAAARRRGLLPVSEDTGTAELSRLDNSTRNRAVFSARTRHVSHLAVIQEMTDKLLGPPADPLQRVSKADARQSLRASLQSLGYDPEDVGARPGSLRDLGSAKRLNLILDHNVREARGYGRHEQQQKPNLLRVWPAQEFVRVFPRGEPRSTWQERFIAAGGSLFEGRMIARKDDPVWTSLSRFGNPWPPFDFGSGMGLRNIRRDEALRLGVIEPGQQVQPDPQEFNAATEMSIAETTGGLFDAIKTQLGSAVEIVGGVLRILPEV